MFGVGSLVFAGEVEEFSFWDNADGDQRLFLEQADGQLRAADELLDQRATMAGDDSLDSAANGWRVGGFEDEDVDAAAAVRRFDDAWAGGGRRGVEFFQDAIRRGRQTGVLPGLLGFDLVHAKARGARRTADERKSARFENLLKLAALAELAV